MDISDYALISISVVLIATSITMLLALRCRRREEIQQAIKEWT